jgi:hypothetical protein
MPTLTLLSEFSEGELVFSAENIKSNYLYGVPLVDPKTGVKLENKTIEFYVRSATQEVERYLQIYLNKKEITETLDYVTFDYYAQYNPLKLNYPILKINSLKGNLGNTELLEIPQQWLTFSKRDYVNSRNMFMVVNGGTEIRFNTTTFINYFGFPSGLLSYSNRTGGIPCFWDITYETGFCGQIPFDVLDLVGMLASIPLLSILGDVRDAGISSKDLSIDGVRASYSTTSSATSSAYSARILEYTKLVDKKVKELKRHFEAIIVDSI